MIYRILTLINIFLINLQFAFAQTDIRISGPANGFPVALPVMCDAGGGSDAARNIPETIIRDLKISGLFQVIDPKTYVEAPGKCTTPESIAFTDWSVIGAEGLVKGDISVSGGQLQAKLYLFDVQRKQAVVGKMYSGDLRDSSKIAHRFANEIVKFFTGEPGIFGSQVAFVSKVGRFKELFIMDSDGQNVRQMTEDVGIVASPSWSPSGDKVIYTSYRSRTPELYWLPPEGGAPRQVTNRAGLEISPKYSPDGSKIAVAISAEGDTNLALMDLRGSVTQYLTRGGQIDVSPSWSPDGSRIAFCSNRGGGPQIYIMSASGGEATRISYTGSTYCTSPAWSPKGDKIAFVCLQGGPQIFMIDAQGGQAVQLTFGGRNEDVSWSPDGRYLIFSSDLGRGAKRIVIQNTNGAAAFPISSGRSEDSQPAWSPRVE
ncbi:Tol-Pal system beta propeller repeat protein TolB [bacterium]|nr:Tol-Pal system beta propeller repeat protein TolB [bacterium]